MTDPTSGVRVSVPGIVPTALVDDLAADLAALRLGQLPGRFREILVLRELEGLSYKEIADVMGMPMGTVMSTLSRARDRFRHAAGVLLETRFASESDSSAVAAEECVGGPRLEISSPQSRSITDRARVEYSKVGGY